MIGPYVDTWSAPPTEDAELPVKDEDSMTTDVPLMSEIAPPRGSAFG